MPVAQDIQHAAHHAMNAWHSALLEWDPVRAPLIPDVDYLTRLAARLKTKFFSTPSKGSLWYAQMNASGRTHRLQVITSNLWETTFHDHEQGWTFISQTNDFTGGVLRAWERQNALKGNRQFLSWCHSTNPLDQPLEEKAIRLDCVESLLRLIENPNNIQHHDSLAQSLQAYLHHTGAMTKAIRLAPDHKSMQVVISPIEIDLDRLSWHNYSAQVLMAHHCQLVYDTADALTEKAWFISGTKNALARIHLGWASSIDTLFPSECYRHEFTHLHAFENSQSGRRVDHRMPIDRMITPRDGSELPHPDYPSWAPSEVDAYLASAEALLEAGAALVYAAKNPHTEAAAQTMAARASAYLVHTDPAHRDQALRLAANAYLRHAMFEIDAADSFRAATAITTRPPTSMSPIDAMGTPYAWMQLLDRRIETVRQHIEEGLGTLERTRFAA